MKNTDRGKKEEEKKEEKRKYQLQGAISRVEKKREVGGV